MAGYGDDNAFTAWLATNGFSLPPGAPAVAVLRQRGSAYLDGLYGARFPGAPSGGFSQERAWPRTGAVAYGQPIPENIIPAAIEQASYFAALREAQQPGSLAATVTPGRQVKREKVEGAVEREFFEAGSDAASNATPVLTAVDGLVAPYLAPSDLGAGFAVWAVGRSSGL